MALITRRSLLTGLIAAPAVVAASSLMPVRAVIQPLDGPYPLSEILAHHERVMRWYVHQYKTIHGGFYTARLAT